MLTQMKISPLSIILVMAGCALLKTCLLPPPRVHHHAIDPPPKTFNQRNTGAGAEKNNKKTHRTSKALHYTQ